MTLEERNAAGFANAIVLDEDEDEDGDEDGGEGGAAKEVAAKVKADADADVESLSVCSLKELLTRTRTLFLTVTVP